MSEEEPVIGIDFGTTYSSVGIWHNGQVKIITDNEGNRRIPSYVTFTDTECLIGDAAKFEAIVNPTNAVFNIKRLLGRKFSDLVAQKVINTLPFEVESNRAGVPEVSVAHKRVQKSFKVEEISVMILAEMKRMAQSFVGRNKEIKKAVIAVPAYFNQSQRQAIKDAGKAAGLEVIELINETTAASIAYTLEKYRDDTTEKCVLVFDMGGGKTDVSLISVKSNIIVVESTASDAHVGGEDFDERMAHHFAKKFEREYSKDVTSDADIFRSLMRECEYAKITLSHSEEAKSKLHAFFEGIDPEINITREEFEELNADLFKRCINLANKCLHDAKIDKSRVQELVLVGESTRIPKIQSMLRDCFSGVELISLTNQDIAVTYGATVQAVVLTRKEELDLLVIDIITRSLNIEIGGSCMGVVCSRNTTIPTKKERDFTTVSDNQEAIHIRVYEEGRGSTMDDNILGHFMLTGIPPAPTGIPQIRVSFEVDASGILTVVSAKEMSTGAEIGVTLLEDAPHGTHNISCTVN